MGRMIRTCALVCLILILYPVCLHCQETVVEVTLDEHDRYEIITRLEELKVRRQQVKMFEEILRRDKEQDARDAELNARAIKVVESERDKAIEERNAYKKALEDATRGRSKKCWVAKIFSAGLVRCN